MAMTLHHIGIISRDAAKTAAAYKDMLGLELDKMGIVNHESHGVKMGFAPTGATPLEFMEAADPPPGQSAKRILDQIEKRGEGLFHLCMFSDDYDTDVANIRGKGYDFDEAEMDQGDGTKLRVGFLSPDDTSGVWIEIVDAAAVPAQFR